MKNCLDGSIDLLEARKALQKVLGIGWIDGLEAKRVGLGEFLDGCSAEKDLGCWLVAD